MSDLWLKLINLIFPITCSECGKSLPFNDKLKLCPGCLAKLTLIDGLYCKKCGIGLPDGGEHCYNCLKNPNYHFEFIRASCAYTDTAKNLVHKLKYRGREYIAAVMARLMVNTLSMHGLDKITDCVAFVPMHGLKEYLRGYNQAELLASKMSEYTNMPLLKGLVRVKFTRPQYRLKKDARRENITGCFEFKGGSKGGIKGKNILLVDDVCTTCATIEECSKVLRQAGANKVYGLVFARD